MRSTVSPRCSIAGTANPALPGAGRILPPPLCLESLEERALPNSLAGLTDAANPPADEAIVSAATPGMDAASVPELNQATTADAAPPPSDTAAELSNAVFSPCTTTAPDSTDEPVPGSLQPPPDQLQAQVFDPGLNAENLFAFHDAMPVAASSERMPDPNKGPLTDGADGGSGGGDTGSTGAGENPIAPPASASAENGESGGGSSPALPAQPAAPPPPASNPAVNTAAPAPSSPVSGVPTSSQLAQIQTLNFEPPVSTTTPAAHAITAQAAATPANTHGGSLTSSPDPTFTFQVGASSTFQLETFYDSDDPSSYSASIDWGDGNTSAGSITVVSAGDFLVSGTHTYVNSGTYPIAVTFTDSNGSLTVDDTAEVDQAPVFTSAASTTVTAGDGNTFTLTTSSFPTAAITESGSLPSGVNFTDNGDGTASLTGSPDPTSNQGGVYNLTFTATNSDSADAYAAQSFVLTVDQAPAITSDMSTTFNVGSAGTFTVQTTGFPTAAVSESGTLPSGVTFADNGDGTGTLAGTPATGAGGVYDLTFTASNGVSGDANQDFTLTVDETPVITSASSTTFTAGQSDSFTVQSDGYPTDTIGWDSGSLPNGVTLVDNGDGTATLAGTPAAGTGGTYNLGFTATNGVGSGYQSFGLTVDEAPAITSDAAPFTVGSSGAFAVLTTGFPAATVTESGTLPSGITFTTNSDGTPELVGTPNTGTAGDYDLTFTASNGIGTEATQDFTLVVGQAPAITSASQTDFNIGSADTFQVTTLAFPIAAITENGSLPSGVTFTDNGNGTATLSGTPAAGTGGNYDLAFMASNGVGPGFIQDFILTVNDASAIISTAAVTFVAGSFDSAMILTSGFPTAAITVSGTLPSGLSFTDNGDGTASLAGTPAPSAAGIYDLTIMDDNGIGSDPSQSFILTINQAPSITSAVTTTFTTGQTGTFTVQTSGFPTATISESGTLPSGITFTDNGNGTATLGGSPNVGTGGVYDLTFMADDGIGLVASKLLVLTVYEAAAPANDGVTLVWSGASGTDLQWITPGNWIIPNGVDRPFGPESGDTVVFDGNVSSKPSFLVPDSTGAVSAINFINGYSGDLILQQSLDVTGFISETCGNVCILNGITLDTPQYYFLGGDIEGDGFDNSGEGDLNITSQANEPGLFEAHGGGTIEVGNFNFDASSTLSIMDTVGVTFENTTINALGTTNWESGDISLPNSEFNNRGTFQITGDGFIDSGIGVPGDFYNYGSFIKTASPSTGVTRIRVAFDNTYVNSSTFVEVDTGRLRFERSGTQNAPFIADGTGILTFGRQGVQILLPGTIFTGTGSMTLTDRAQFQIAAGYNQVIDLPIIIALDPTLIGRVERVAIFGVGPGTGALLGTQSSIQFNQALTWKHGAFQNLNVKINANALLTGDGLKILLESSVDISSNSTFTWEGSGNIFLRNTKIDNFGAFKIATDQASIDQDPNPGDTSLFVNDNSGVSPGLVTKVAGTNVTNIDVPFENSTGVLNLNGFNLAFNSSFQQIGGDTGSTLLKGGVLYGDSLVFSGGTLIGSAGTIIGSVTIDGATVKMNSPTSTLLIVGSYTQLAGTLEVNVDGLNNYDTFVILGTVSLEGGNLQVNRFWAFTPPVGSQYAFLWSAAISGSIPVSAGWNLSFGILGATLTKQ